MPPNFVLLDASLPDVARLVTAMVQARDAVERRSWSHPQEPTSNEWWADVPGRSGGAPRSDKYHNVTSPLVLSTGTSGYSCPKKQRLTELRCTTDARGGCWWRRRQKIA